MPICARATSTTRTSASRHHLRSRFMMLGVSQTAPEMGSGIPRQKKSRLVNGAQHPTPASALGQVRERFNHADQTLPESTRSVVGAAGFDGPVDQKRAAHDGVPIDEAPVAAVQAV